MGTQKNRRDGSFEHPKHVFQLMNKKIIAFYRLFLFCLTGPMSHYTLQVIIDVPLLQGWDVCLYVPVTIGTVPQGLSQPFTTNASNGNGKIIGS